jgi:hypothetical protein
VAQENLSKLNFRLACALGNEKRPASASAVTSPELSGAPEGEKTIRSSDTSMAKDFTKLQELKDIVGNFSSPSIDPENLRNWIRGTFPK